MTSPMECEACGKVTMQLRAAEALAREVEVLVHRHVIDARSPAADVLLDYRDSKPCTEAGQRIANLEQQVELLQAENARLSEESRAAAARRAHAEADRAALTAAIDEAGVPKTDGEYVVPLLQRIRILVDRARRAAEADRWAKRMRDLENRIRHAREVLRGGFDPPAIDEIRRVRGLEPLPQLEEAE